MLECLSACFLIESSWVKYQSKSAVQVCIAVLTPRCIMQTNMVDEGQFPHALSDELKCVFCDLAKFLTQDVILSMLYWMSNRYYHWDQAIQQLLNVKQILSMRLNNSINYLMSNRYYHWDQTIQSITECHTDIITEINQFNQLLNVKQILSPRLNNSINYWMSLSNRY